MEKLNENEFQNTINCLHIELTRRCNMKCLFCSRGEAENVDINKEIVDKIFDLLKKSNVAIRYLRLGG